MAENPKSGQRNNGAGAAADGAESGQEKKRRQNREVSLAQLI